MRIRTSTVLLISILLIAPSQAANAANSDAVTAQSSFENGNAAFRIGDYSSALANYNDALVNGKDSPRLFYNIGLTHYRLGQYSQARSAFMDSANDNGLAALSYYQLGVLAKEAGDSSSAAIWFTRSRNRAESSKLRELSTQALETVAVPQSMFLSDFSAGYGNDSNAFRAPHEPYIDLSQDPPIPVVPIVYSGTYVPIRFNAAYINPVSNRSQFVGSYRHRGNYYNDAALENADQTDHRITIGMTRDLGRDKSSAEQFSFATVLRSHNETNFDRDDGLDRFDDGSSIAERFNYLSIGAEFELKNRIGRTRYELDGGITVRDYEDVSTASPYDLTAYWVGGAFKFPLTRKTRLEIGYQYRARDYDERHARDEDGNGSNQNPTLSYRYNTFVAGIRQRFSDVFAAELSYYYTIRDDEFESYNDYTKHKIRLNMNFDFSDKFAVSIRIDTHDLQYPNAFAFDQPGLPQKEYQEIQVTARALYRLTGRLSLLADVKQEAIESSDPRGEYDRTRTSIGINWAF